MSKGYVLAPVSVGPDLLDCLDNFGQSTQDTKRHLFEVIKQATRDLKHGVQFDWSKGPNRPPKLHRSNYTDSAGRGVHTERLSETYYGVTLAYTSDDEQIILAELGILHDRCTTHKPSGKTGPYDYYNVKLEHGIRDVVPIEFDTSEVENYNSNYGVEVIRDFIKALEKSEPIENES